MKKTIVIIAIVAITASLTSTSYAFESYTIKPKKKSARLIPSQYEKWPKKQYIEAGDGTGYVGEIKTHKNGTVEVYMYDKPFSSQRGDHLRYGLPVY